MREKQKILIVHNYYQYSGGEDTVVANEKRLLEENGHKVLLYTRHNKELKSMNLLKKTFLPFVTIFNPRSYLDIKKIIRKEKIDIVHVHNTLGLISPSVYYAALKMNVPVIQTIHNFRLICPGATFYREGHICEDCVNKGLHCAVINKCYRNSRIQTMVCVVNTLLHRHTGIMKKINYIVLTKFNYSKLMQSGIICPSHIFIKPNFSFDNKYVKIPVEFEHFYLFVGRIEEIKGIKVLIQAFSKLKNKNLIVVGDGPLFAKTSEYLVKHKIENIKMFGKLEHEKTMFLIKKAQAVILPSQVYEGFPMTLVEAFSVSTPMIVSDIGNLGYLIKNGDNGIKFTYNSVNSLINAVDEFEQSDINRLKKNSYITYLNNYSPNANYTILKSIYDSISRFNHGSYTE